MITAASEGEPLESGESPDPERTCAVTRATLPPEQMLRFVAGPDDQIVPDLAHKLPGRGVWVTATHTAVSAAVKQNAFAKSLKRKLFVDPDLAGRVEALLAVRVREAFSFARKAGSVVTGFAKVDAALADGTGIALVHASDAAADGSAKLDRKLIAVRKSRGQPAPIVRALSSAEMSLAIGRDNVVHAALTEGGASRKFLNAAERLRRYRLSETTANIIEQPAAAMPPSANTD